MGDLISRKALLESMDDKYNAKKDEVPDKLAEGFMQMEKLIKEQPSVEAVPVVRGEWEDNPYIWECNQCHKWLLVENGDADMNFCPECGADMRKKVQYGKID